MIIFIIVLHMKITCGNAQFLFSHPLPAQPFIFFITTAFLCLFRFPFSSFTFVITLDPIRRRMPHTIRFIVMVVPCVAVPGLSVGICSNGTANILSVRLRGHTIQINLTRDSLRFPFLVFIFINLGKIKVFPNIECSALQWLVGFSTVFFKAYVVIALEGFFVAV